MFKDMWNPRPGIFILQNFLNERKKATEPDALVIGVISFLILSMFSILQLLTLPGSVEVLFSSPL